MKKYTGDYQSTREKVYETMEKSDLTIETYLEEKRRVFEKQLHNIAVDISSLTIHPHIYPAGTLVKVIPSKVDEIFEGCNIDEETTIGVVVAPKKYSPFDEPKKDVAGYYIYFDGQFSYEEATEDEIELFDGECPERLKDFDVIEFLLPKWDHVSRFCL